MTISVNLKAIETTEEAPSAFQQRLVPATVSLHLRRHLLEREQVGFLAATDATMHPCSRTDCGAIVATAGSRPFGFICRFCTL